MIYAIIGLILGFILLAWSADKLIDGASALAVNMGISPLLVGLTVIAFGTSLPEMFVSATASFDGNAGLAIGNALGSNIANIAFVLALAAIVKPIDVRSDILKREYPILFFIMILMLALFMDGDLNRLDGVIFFFAFGVLLLWVVRTGLKQAPDPMTKEFKQEIPKHMSNLKASSLLIIGLVLLPLSSKILVDSATTIAEYFQISAHIIGLSIVAFGTSLPEVAASIAGVLKNEDDIVVGNILGSNMFNIVAVLPFPGIFAPGILPAATLARDVPIMFIITILLFLFSMSIKGLGRFSRSKGILFLSSYIAYVGYLFWR